MFTKLKYFVFILPLIIVGCNTGYEPQPIVVSPEIERSGRTNPGFNTKYSNNTTVNQPTFKTVVTQETPSTTGAISSQRKAALLLPLSGRHSGLGQRMLNAATMAQQDMGHKNFTLLPIDTKGTKNGAIAAAQTANAKNADIILGPIFSGSVQAVTALSQNTPIISFSNNANIAAPNVYVLGYQQQQMLGRLLNYSFDQNIMRYTVVVPKGRMESITRSTLEDFAADKFVSIVPFQAYTPTVDGMNKAVKELAATLQPAAATDDDTYNANSTAKTAIVAAIPPSQLEAFVSMLRYHDIPLNNVQLLGNLSWKMQYALNTPELKGAWYAAPSSKARKSFDKRYTAAFKEAPKSLESLAYDAVAMAAVLAKNTNTPYSANALQNHDGFQGVDGLFYLRPGGTIDRKFAIYEIGSSFKQISAPQ